MIWTLTRGIIHSNQRDSNTNYIDSVSSSDLQPATVDCSNTETIPSYLPENFWKNELRLLFSFGIKKCELIYTAIEEGLQGVENPNVKKGKIDTNSIQGSKTFFNITKLKILQ